MTVTLNHTIVQARDQDASARFLSDILGLAPPTTFAHFTIVQVGETSLDFSSTGGEIAPRHFAFLVSEAEFDEIFGRISQRAMPYWADPGHHEPGEINRRDNGRGLYFEDPDGHNLEILTRPYGSGSTATDSPAS